MKKYLVLIVLLLSTISGFSQEKTNYLKESEEEFSKRMQWFTDAKYGMFIHFGLYSRLGGL